MDTRILNVVMKDAERLPCVDVLVPVLNEASLIDGKLQNLAALEYPAGHRARGNTGDTRRRPAA